MSYTQKISDVVAWTVSDEYSIDLAVVTVPAGGLVSGAILESTSVAGKFTRCATATVGNANAVLADERADYGTLAAGDHTLKVVRRTAIVNGSKLSVTSGVIATAMTALRAAGIKVL